MKNILLALVMMASVTGSCFAMTDDKALINQSFLQAVKQGNYLLVEDLIKRGADVNTRTEQDQTALQFLVEYFLTLWRTSLYKDSTLKLIKLLVRNQGTPLKIIEDKNYLNDKELEKLVLGARLLEAAKAKNYEEAEKLILMGADMDFQDREGNSALSYLSFENEQLCACVAKADADREAAQLAAQNSFSYRAQRVAYKVAAVGIVGGMMIGKAGAAMERERTKQAESDKH